jgi:ABC-type branched-subunit amino acid transport system ATPase component
VLLEISGLGKRFGGLVALSNIELNVAEGAVHGVIGPNGSGKSTLFNVVSGVYPADPGSVVRFRGENITNREPHEIARRGIARTFQLLRIFSEMTVIENLLVGCHRHVDYGIGAAVGRRLRARDRAAAARQGARSARLCRTRGLRGNAGRGLSIGQRRLLALGRAMAMKPSLLMLDEPAAGLSPINVDKLLDIITALRARYGVTVILVEHVMKLVMASCDIVTVIDHGEKIAEGRPDEIRDDHRVLEAYLGKEMKDAEVRAFLKAV